ncbi:MAG: HPr(Ser) kinase/phosphatase [Limisphaerales bacterium]|jgi:HPr kinase/phosphorylase|nr:HPr(Ser) kinase/phosphatase [Verrucomicrobiota bacterium]
MQKATSITVATFLEHCSDLNPLSLECGEKGLRRLIHEPAVNRPGFALAGFTRHFPHRRIQVFGRAECSYLKSLSPEERGKCYKNIFKYRIPCFVFCRGLLPESDFLEAAKKEQIPVFRSPLITMRFMNQATHTLDELFAPRKLEVGCMVDILGVGVLIKGKSGIGKSECVLSLLERGYSLVSDDVTEIFLSEGKELVAAPTREMKDFMEVRGIGIINVADMFGIKSIRTRKRLDMVVTLSVMEETEEIDRLGKDDQTIDIMGVKVPHMTLPVSAGRDTGRLVEVAAFQNKLKIAGHPLGMDQYNERILKKMQRDQKAKKRSIVGALRGSGGKIEE